MTIPPETYSSRIGRHKAYTQGLRHLKPRMATLKKLLARHDELAKFLEFLQKPGNFERVQRERAARAFWVLWFIILVIALGFDSTFTFSSTAASLRDTLSRLLPFVSARLDFFVALAFGATVLAITLGVRLSTETLKDRERLNAMAADSPEVEDLLASMRRKKAARRGWAVVLTVLLAIAAISDLMAIRAYDQIASTTGAHPAASIADANPAISSTAARAQMLQLVTPYAVTDALHFLLLFVPLPSSSPFLPYPCSPQRAEKNMRRVSRRIGDTGRLIYETVAAVPHEMARDQLVGIFGEEERTAVNNAVGRVVFDGSFKGNGTAVPLGRDCN